MSLEKSIQPFKFGEVVESSVFLNRTEDIRYLHNNFKSGISTIIISPRRWGKSSLVKKAAAEYTKSNTVFVFLDCFRLHSKEQFLEEYAAQMISATTSKVEEKMHAVKDFFKGIIPELGFTADMHNEVSLKLKWKSDDLPESEILNLPQEIAKKKGINIIVCIDEFQNIALWDKKMKFQQTLRSYWQHHSVVTYCLYGSKRHLMIKFFNKSSMPFYRFGDVIQLKKITRAHWQEFITARFVLFKKSISMDLAGKIADKVKCHSYYVQQLAHITFYNTIKETTEDTLKIALVQLLEQNQIIYQRIIEELSPPQIEFLRALGEGVTAFYSKKTMKKYDLGTVGNIKRIKEALETKEVIDFYDRSPSFVDPVFEIWFRTYYLNEPL